VATGGDAVGPPRPVLFPLAWFLAGFVFLSLSTAKRGTYLLPLYPAAALLVAWLWDQALATRTRTPWLAVPLGLAAAGSGGLALTLVVVPRRLVPGHMVDTLVPATAWQLAGVVAILVGGAAAVWVPWRRGRPGAALGALVAVQALLLLAAATARAPEYEERFPVREFTARVRALVPDGEPILSLLGDYNFLVAFYLNRPLRPLPDPATLLATRARAGPRYAFVDEQDAGILDQPGVHVLAETRFGPRRPRRIVLVRLDPVS
jgi:4-amino-4-deoxy-L-arabinose transferase-like glycosyltransferase